MTTIITDPGLYTRFPLQTVAYKDALDDAEWIDGIADPEFKHVYCSDIYMATNAYDRAELNRVIGNVLQPGESAFQMWEPFDMVGKFVRISVYDPTTLAIAFYWYGYVVSEEIEREAVKESSGGNVLTGRMQRFTAAGLEYFLDRVQIDSSIIHDTDRVSRTYVFNGGRTNTATWEERANRNAVVNADGYYSFSNYDATPALWTATNIADYLLYYHGPKDKDDNDCPTPFVLTAATAAILATFTPVLNVGDLTVFQALNKIASPQRGLVWWAEYNDDDNEIEIRVETMTPSNVSLPSGGTFPANSSKIEVDFDTELDVLESKVRTNRSRQYKQVVARGARMTSTFTIGYKDTTLREDWTPTEEVLYKRGAGGTNGYDALIDDEKAKRNDAYRQSEDFARVFSSYRIPADWNGKSGNGDDAARNWTFPELSSNGSVMGGTKILAQALKLLPHTMLKRGWDYTDTSNPTSNSPVKSASEYMPTLVVVRVASEPDTFQLVDRMREHDFENDGEDESDEIKTSYSVSMQKVVPGLRLRPSGSMPHAIAIDNWGDAEPSAYEPEVNYKTLRATVCAEADVFAEAEYPQSLTGTDTLEKLTIYLGDSYRLDYLAQSTIVGLRNGVPKLSTGGILRDDRTYLQDIAYLAYQWYQEARATIEVKFRQIRYLFELGDMVTTIGSGATQETVNTVVTAVHYDLANGTMAVVTSDDTLDVRSLVR